MKRVKIASEQELRNWLAKTDHVATDVMIVTVAERASAKHVSANRIQKTALAYGWKSGAAYNLNGGLRGQVIRRSQT